MLCDSGLEGWIEVSLQFGLSPAPGGHSPKLLLACGPGKHEVNKLSRLRVRDTHSDTGIWRETFIVVVSFDRRHGGLITTGNAGE